MKRKFTAFLLLGLMACSVFCGCNNSINPDTDATTASEETTVATTPTLAATEMDYSGVYDMLLSKTYKFIANADDETIPDEGQFGIFEALTGVEGDTRLQRIGYVTEDINKDNIPELLVFAVNENGDQKAEGTRVLAAYTCSGSDVKLVFEGNSRNRYYVLSDGTIYNESPSSGVYAIFANCELPYLGTSLSVKDYYFTSPLEGDPTETGYYHNTTGVIDVTSSELFTDSMDGFEQKQKEYSKDIKVFELTDFKSLGEEGLTSYVYAEYIENTDVDPDYCESFEVENTGYERTVVFFADGEVSGFKLLSLQYTDVNSYTSEELYSFDLSEEEPLAVNMMLNTAPSSFGISYVNSKGEEVTFAVELSGFDGSIILNKI